MMDAMDLRKGGFDLLEGVEEQVDLSLSILFAFH
jgi:hypothetical protein